MQAKGVEIMNKPNKLDKFKVARDRAVQSPFGKISAEKLAELAALAGDEQPIISETEMRIKGVKLTSIGADIPAEMSGEDLHEVLLIIARLEGSLNWIIGDLLVYSETRKYGKALEWAAAFDRSAGTIYNWCSVCRAYPKSSRRHELSFKHHQVIAGHDKRFELLEEAVENGWSAAQLKRAVYPPVLPSGWETRANMILVRIKNLVKKGVADRHAMAEKLREMADELERSNSNLG